MRCVQAPKYTWLPRKKDISPDIFFHKWPYECSKLYNFALLTSLSLVSFWKISFCVFFSLLTSYISWLTEAPFCNLLILVISSLLGSSFSLSIELSVSYSEKGLLCFLIHFIAIFYWLIWFFFLFLSLGDIFIVDSPSVEEGWLSKMPSLQLLHLTKHRHNILASRRYHRFHYLFCESTLHLSWLH